MSNITEHRHWVEKSIMDPAVVELTHDGRIEAYDHINCRHVEVVPTSHYLQHCARVISSAKKRYAKTVDPDGNRIPCIDLPDALRHVRFVESAVEAQMNAIDNFSRNYDLLVDWPDCTVRLIVDLTN